MRKIVLPTAVALALTASGAAFAADIPAKAPAPAYKTPVAAAYNWTGFYLGINGGAAWGRSNWQGIPTGNFNTSGGLLGLTLGYNAQNGPWVFGLEGDIDWASIKGNATDATFCVPTCSTKTDWLGTVRARIGYAFDRVLPYATGGLALGDIKASQPGFAGATTTKAGWTVGGGIEFALTGPLTAKVEYLYVDLGNITCAAGVCAALANPISHKISVVRAGLNYRF